MAKIRLLTRTGAAECASARIVAWFDVLSTAVEIDGPTSDFVDIDIQSLPTTANTIGLLNTAAVLLDSRAAHGGWPVEGFDMTTGLVEPNAWTCMKKLFRNRSAPELRALLPTAAFCADMCTMLHERDVVMFGYHHIFIERWGHNLADGALAFVWGERGALELHSLKLDSHRLPRTPTLVCRMQRQGARVLRKHLKKVLFIVRFAAHSLQELAGSNAAQFAEPIARVRRSLDMWLLYGGFDYPGRLTAPLFIPTGSRILVKEDFAAPDFEQAVDGWLLQPIGETPMPLAMCEARQCTTYDTRVPSVDEYSLKMLLLQFEDDEYTDHAMTQEEVAAVRAVWHNVGDALVDDPQRFRHTTHYPRRSLLGDGFAIPTAVGWI